MKLLMKSVLACAALIGLPACAEQANGCPDGSYSLVLAPDGTTLSILFDKFSVESSPTSSVAMQRKVCRISAPLKLPANHSIGVYKVDYRGFAKLAPKQETELDVNRLLKNPQPLSTGRLGYTLYMENNFFGRYDAQVRRHPARPVQLPHA